MGLRFRKVVRLGPVLFNFGKRGYSSTTLKLGQLSRNSRSRRWTLDLPGPFSWVFGKRRGRQ